VDERVAQLRQIVSADRVLTDPADLIHWGQDWTRFYQPAPLAIVQVSSAAEVVELVRFARATNTPLVPSGGRTGLSGGAVADRGEVVVSFDKMNRVLDYDEVDGNLTVEPGVITARIQQLAEEQSRAYPVDFASSGSSQIGGNIATNAGGIRVIKYGLTRNWVAGLKVVTGRGDLLSLNNGLVKNATGYDLRHLFIGSEGTLGFIVEATIHLARMPGPPTVLLLGVPELSNIPALLALFQSKVVLSAFEFFSDAALSKVMDHTDKATPFRSRTPYYALLEVDDLGPDGEAVLLELFEQALSAEVCIDGVISQSQSDVNSLWEYREFISEAITPYTPYKNDVSVTPARVPEFLTAVDEFVSSRYPSFEIIWFGHIGDGNLHLNILKPEAMSTEEFKAHCEVVSDETMAIVQRYNGSISAEHGVGKLKLGHLQYSRDETEQGYLRAMKQVFDPDGIMNPGKLIPG